MLYNSDDESMAINSSTTSNVSSTTTTSSPSTTLNILRDSSRILRNLEKDKLKTTPKNSIPVKRESHLKTFLKKIEQRQTPSTGMRNILLSLIPSSILHKKPLLSSGTDGNLKILEKKTKSSLKFVKQSIQPPPIKPNLHLLNDILDKKILSQTLTERNLTIQSKKSLDPGLHIETSKSLLNFFSSVEINDDDDDDIEEYVEDDNEDYSEHDVDDSDSDTNSVTDSVTRSDIKPKNETQILKKKKVSFTIASDDDEPSNAPVIDDEEEEEDNDDDSAVSWKKKKFSMPPNQVITNSLMDVEAENEDSNDEDEIFDERLIEEEIAEMVDDSEIGNGRQSDISSIHSRLRKEEEESEMNILMKRFVPESEFKKGDSYRALKEKYFDGGDDGGSDDLTNTNSTTPTLHTKDSSLHDRIWKGLPQTQKSHSSLIKLIEKDLSDSDYTCSEVDSLSESDVISESDIDDGKEEEEMKSEIDYIKEDEEHSFMYLKRNDVEDFDDCLRNTNTVKNPIIKKRKAFTLDPVLENRLQVNTNTSEGNSRNTFDIKNMK